MEDLLNRKSLRLQQRDSYAIVKKYLPSQFRINKQKTDTCAICRRSDSPSVSTVDMMDRPKDIEVLKYLATRLELNFDTYMAPMLGQFLFCFKCWGLYNNLFTMTTKNTVHLNYFPEHDEPFESVVLEIINRVHSNPTPHEIEVIAVKSNTEKQRNNNKATKNINNNVDNGINKNKVVQSSQISSISTTSKNTSQTMSSIRAVKPSAFPNMISPVMTSEIRTSAAMKNATIPFPAMQFPTIMPGTVRSVAIKKSAATITPTPSTVKYSRKQNLYPRSEEFKPPEKIVPKPAVHVLHVLPNVSIYDCRPRFSNVRNKTCSEPMMEKHANPHFPVISSETESVEEVGKIRRIPSQLAKQLNVIRERRRRRNLAKGIIEEIELVPVDEDEPMTSNIEYEFDSAPTINSNLNKENEDYGENEIPDKSNLEIVEPTIEDVFSVDDYNDDDNESMTCDLSLSDPLGDSDSGDRILEAEISFQTVLKDHAYTKLSKSSGPEQPFTCELCDVSTPSVFPSEEKLILHTTGVHNNSPKSFVCLQCNKTFVAQFLLNRHMKFHSFDKTKPIACDVCENRFATEAEFSAHLFESHSEVSGNARTSGCCFCPTRLYNFWKLREHEIKKHYKELKHACEKCDERFSHKSLLESHQITHSQDGPFTCTICQLSFEKDFFLSHHILTVHMNQRFNLTKLEQAQEELAEYICQHKSCGRVFNSRAAFLLHQKTSSFHTNPEELAAQRKKITKIKCEFCSTVFIGMSSAVSHTIKLHEMKASPEEKTRSCAKCEKKFKSQILLDRHIKLHNNLDKTKPLSCNICDCRFSKDEEEKLKEHMKYRHQKASLMFCRFCKKGFAQSRNLHVHEQKHPELVTHCCTICEKKYTLAIFLEIHLKTHLTEGPYDCTLYKTCAAFQTPELLAKHLSTHTGENTFINPCPECSMVFRQKDTLKKHLSEAHGHQKEFKCEICGYEFVVRVRYLRHMRHKHPDPSQQQISWLCDFCGKSFKNSAVLYTHKYIKHMNRGKIKDIRKRSRPKKVQSMLPKEDIQPLVKEDSSLMRLNKGPEGTRYVCAICDKPYKTQRQLTYHMNTHTGLKPYKCKYCDKMFHNPMHMRGHMPIHKMNESGTERKKFPCTQCDRVFLLKHQLNFHMNKHNGLKPYKCRICHKKFSHPGLIGHFKVHMGNGTYVPPGSGETDEADSNNSNSEKNESESDDPEES